MATGLRSPLNFSLEQPRLDRGVHVSLFNNAWGTNYLQWHGGDWLYQLRIFAWEREQIIRLTELEAINLVSQVQRARLQSRIYRHHVPLFLLSACAVAALYTTRPYKDVAMRLSFATAYPALVLLVLTLLIGPWRLLRGQKTPISSDLRRDVGIWAGMLGVFHAAIGQNVHLRGRPWLYYVYEYRAHGPSGLRHDLFGVNNFTGLLGSLILIALFVTSNDWFLRRLGTPRWKQLQRWNYVCFALSAAHTIGYQVMEKQEAAFVVTAVSCIAITIVFQATGFVLRRRRETGRHSMMRTGQLRGR